MVLSERFSMGVRDPIGVGDPWYYLKRFCSGVRDPRYYPKSSVWVLEIRSVIPKVLLPRRKHTVIFITYT